MVKMVKSMLTIFTLPDTFVASTTAYIGETITDLNVLVVLAIGLPLAFWGIKRIIGLMPRGR